MNELDGVDTNDEQFDKLVHQLATQIRNHVQDEGSRLFPQLRKSWTPKKLQELGQKVETAKKMAPTRPPPAAPDRPPLNKMPGAGTALVDRMRDFLTGRGQT